MFAKLSIMNKGLLMVAVSLVFQLSFLLVIFKINESVEESLKQEHRARKIVTHIQNLRRYFEHAGYSLAQFKHSDFNPQDLERFENFEDSFIKEVKELREEVKDNHLELETVNRIDYFANKAKAIISEYIKELQAGSSFTQVTTLLKLAKLGQKIEPDIDGLLIPYEQKAQERYLSARHKRDQLNQFLWVGIPLEIVIALVLWRMFATVICKRLIVIVDNIRRLEKKEKLNSIMVPDQDEIHLVDVRFHQLAHDLTENERRAHEIEKLKHEFVSMISHDLRSPLTSLQFTLGLLEDGTYGEITEKGLQRVSTANKSVVRLIGLINDLLDLEKMESGMITLQKSDVNVHGLFGDAIGSVSGMAEQAKIKLESKPVDAVFVGDMKRISQVLVNLLSNAIKFSPEGSTVSLTAEDGDPRFLKICVTDRGRGIPEECQKTIFERFKQVKEADGQLKKGTGLGLAIAKQLVEQHGGTIGVESLEGEGSTFWLRIPKTSPVLTEG